MIAVPPTEPPDGAQRVVFAKNQPEYDPLPACMEANGRVLTEWEFSAEELARIVNGGRLRLWIYTFRHPLQPILIEVVD